MIRQAEAEFKLIGEAAEKFAAPEDNAEGDRQTGQYERENFKRLLQLWREKLQKPRCEHFHTTRAAKGGRKAYKRIPNPFDAG